ncbi:MAG: hypothetical protein NTW98_00695 [Candidatus Nomurabacteria bacterium]|nr:hypothetical protein [Candidatus Nomurabacteria bacterium]
MKMKNILKNLIILGAMVLFVASANVTNAQTTVIPGATEAILNASINPNGTATSAWFEYGTDMNMVYFSETPHVYVGSVFGEVPFSQKITGLSASNVYFYRAVANNGTIAKGSIMSFTTVTNNNATDSSNVTSVNTNYNPQGPSVTTNQGQLIGNQNYSNSMYPNNTLNNTTITTDTALTANSLFGANFLPNNIFGWLLLLLVILAVVWAVRKLAQPTTYVVQR